MKKISVTYRVDDDEFKRLLKIVEKYKEQGLPLTPEKAFESIMTPGCKFDIDERLKIHESRLGIENI